MNVRLVNVHIGIVVALLLMLPIAAHAQTASTDLQSAVRAALLSDPRSAGMAPAQFDALVLALTQQVQKQGLSVYDLTWHPQQPSTFSTQSAENVFACDPQSFLCTFNMAFGFSGNDMTIPIALGITSALLLLIIGGMIAMHRRAVLETPKPITPSFR